VLFGATFVANGKMSDLNAWINKKCGLRNNCAWIQCIGPECSKECNISKIVKNQLNSK
jgi:hypothetical protein